VDFEGLSRYDFCVAERVVPRVVAAIVSVGRGSLTTEDAAKPIIDEVNDAQFSFVRSVTVNGELHFIQQMVSTVSNTNEADAIVMVGGTGIGPRDFTCEAIDSFVERHIEGFGEDYRRLLREEFDAGPGAMLARATAGVYNRCLIFALPRHPARLRRAMQVLVVPTLVEAFQLASGRFHGQRLSDVPPTSRRP
jgi:molybdenum cofactor biosynthesis protein B